MPAAVHGRRTRRLSSFGNLLLGATRAAGARRLVVTVVFLVAASIFAAATAVSVSGLLYAGL